MIRSAIIKAFAVLGWKYRIYSVLRLWTCPFEKIERFVPRQGRILELGCGLGIMSWFMFLSSPIREITGIDCEFSRIERAQKVALAAPAENIRFIPGDIVSADYGNIYNCILLVDVLFQLSKQDKIKVIERCVACLEGSGELIVKEMDRQPFWKLAWCYLQEATVARAAGLNKRNIELLASSELAVMLRAAGFRVRRVRIDPGYPYPHTLFVCKKQVR